MYSRWLYTLCFTLLLPAILLRLLWRSRKAPDYRRRWAERFGRFTAPPWPATAIWVHAVSVGETLAAIPLLKALQQRYPHSPLVITTTTPTGSARVQTLFAEAIQQQRVFHVYAPYDLPWSVNAFLQRLKPRLLIIMETELWPNLLHGCIRYQIPVILANARLSEKSAQGYRRLAPLTRNMLKKIYRIAAQHSTDGERFVQLGFDLSRLVITGSIKFDMDFSPAVTQLATQLHHNWSQDNQRLVWLAASTHPGEDEMILRVFSALKKSFPTLLLVLVPRHPERFNTVYRLCADAGWQTLRRSEGAASTPQTDIVLGDTMGELLAFYGACDVAFVGGSLVPVGGHNLIEPASWGKAILSGPHLHNFAEIARLMEDAGAMVVCQQPDDLLQHLHTFLSDPARRMSAGLHAHKLALQNRGALARLLSVIDYTLERWKSKYPSQPWG